MASSVARRPGIGLAKDDVEHLLPGKTFRQTVGRTVMLDFLGTVATAALIVFVISTLLIFMEASRGAKLWLAALLGLWVGIAAAGSAAGWAAAARPFPITGIFVATPLAAAALATAWPAARRAMLSLPLPLLAGLNIGPVFPAQSLMLTHQHP